MAGPASASSSGRKATHKRQRDSLDGGEHVSAEVGHAVAKRQRAQAVGVALTASGFCATEGCANAKASKTSSTCKECQQKSGRIV